ncbi:hypothetical protein BY996DRAFT_4574820 [Phakopsora pachyrhizi]|nr:hypothetical protein BY996DRAFT_4574820 [Phakopsora pachyrhizi]
MSKSPSNSRSAPLGRTPVTFDRKTDGALKERRNRSWMSLILFVCTFVILSSVSFHLRYALPKPRPLPVLNQSNQAKNDSLSSNYFSETLANQYIHHLADEIGYRVVGTEEMQDSVEYLLEVLGELKTQSQAIGSTKKFEIFHQQDDGAHLFEFMNKNVWKKYYNLSNVIVRIYDPFIPNSKENTVLVNSHLDSTLPSPGASDDLAGVSVMLEAIRIITQSADWKMHNGVVFLFNGAEESLQDGSHMFITKHPLKDVVRAVINLEACGTHGQEILFQATSQEMIKAYSKVPRPFGSIVATEVFKTGLIVSDTDFRQFAQYGNLTGLDMAIMQNSYFYHTSLDISSNIEPGAIQHMGENTVALLKHLTSQDANLKDIKPAAETVFFSALGGLVFVMYSKATALTVYTTLAVLAASLIVRNVNSGSYRVYFWGIVATLGSFFGSIVSANIVAFIIETCLEKPLSWYRNECFPILVFGPPAIFGALAVQYIFSRAIRTSTSDQKVLSHSIFSGLLVLNGSLSVVGAFFNVGSAYVPAFVLFSMIISLLMNDFLLAPITGDFGYLHLPTFLVSLILPTLFGIEGLLAFLDLFVPLTGRIGHEVHGDHIIATLVSVLGFNTASIILPFAHQFSSRALGRFLILGSIFTIIVVHTFTRDSWKVFDKDHPRRLPILHMENLTTTPSTFSFHIASMDRAPNFKSTVKTIAHSLSLDSNEVSLNTINEDIPDWDIIYPVSQFLISYQIPLASAEHQMVTNGKGETMKYNSPWRELFKVTTISSKLDYIKQHRTLSIAIDHPGIIWSVIAFTADVVSWDLPVSPERGSRRHHVKEASSFGVDRWTLSLTIALDEEQFENALRNEQIQKGQRQPVSLSDKNGLEQQKRGMLRIDYSGLDHLGLFPARSKPKFSRTGKVEWTGKGNGGPGMKIFGILKDKLPDWIDPFHISAISNVAYV